MGIFDSLFGSKEKSKAETTSLQTNKGTSSQTSNEVRSSTQAGSASTKQTSSSLDDETIELLRGLIGDISGSVGSGASSTSERVSGGLDSLDGFAEFLKQRAGGGQEAIEAATEAAVAKSERGFELGEGARIAQAQQNVGSRFGNTFSQLIEAEGNAALAAETAGIRANASVAGRELENNELSVVANLLLAQPELAARTEGQEGTQQIANLSQLVGLLKGAETVSTGEEQTTQTLVDIIDRIVSGEFEENQTGSSQSQQTTKKRNSILGTLAQFR